MVLTEADFLAEVQSFIKKVGLKMYKQLFINDLTVLNSFKKNLPKCHVSCTLNFSQDRFPRLEITLVAYIWDTTLKCIHQNQIQYLIL